MKWLAKAELENGTTIEREFPYTADGIWMKESKEAYKCEKRIISEATETGVPVKWYSVDLVEN